MKNILLKTFILLIIGSVFSSRVTAQGLYGNTQLFDMKYADGGTWATLNHVITIGGYVITVQGISSDSPTRSKSFTTINNGTTIPSVSFTGAVKCRSVEISEMASLGEITLAIQNGSSSNLASLEVQIYNGSEWIKADEITLGGNASTLWQPGRLISKSAVAVKFVFPFDCWFYGVKAYNHKDEATAASAPALLQATPPAGAVLPAEGNIRLQFDKLVKVAGNASSVSLGDAAINSIESSGNTILIHYSG
jgi:hypothetical protein